jgi:hypothetical protein
MVREKARKDRATTGVVWDSSGRQVTLTGPLGTSLQLTRDEAASMAREAFGRRPDLPSGAEYVRKLRPIWRGLLKHKDG